MIDFTPIREKIAHMSVKDCRVRMEQIDEQYQEFHGNEYLIAKYNKENPIRTQLLQEEYYLLANRVLELDPWVKGEDRTGTTKHAMKGYGNRKRVKKVKQTE